VAHLILQFRSAHPFRSYNIYKTHLILHSVIWPLRLCSTWWDISSAKYALVAPYLATPPYLFASGLPSRSMFSQLRDAVGNLAAQPIRRSTSQDDDTSNVMSRTNSDEGGALSSTHLADSALSSIRRSLQAQRSSNPALAGTNGTTNAGVHDPNRSRSRLEERLRASLSFGTGEMSSPSTEFSTNVYNTPTLTKGPSPGTDATPLSPTLTPLPESPISPTTESRTRSLSSLFSLGDPMGAGSAVSSTSSLSHSLVFPKTESEYHPGAPVVTTSRTNDELSQPNPSHHGSKSVDSLLVDKLERVVELDEDDEEFQGRRYAEAQMPLPPTPPSEPSKLPAVDSPTPDPPQQRAVVGDAGKDDISPTVTADPPQTDPDTKADSGNVTISSTDNADGDAVVTDVEALRQQLKRFKERFTGSETTDIG